VSAQAEGRVVVIGGHSEKKIILPASGEDYFSCHLSQTVHAVNPQETAGTPFGQWSILVGTFVPVNKRHVQWVLGVEDFGCL
jgi:hypothetical protein